MSVVIDTSPAEEVVRKRQETVARRKRLWRRGRGCALWVVPIAIVIGVGTWCLVTMVAWADQRAGERALAEARAEGVPLTMPDLVALQPTSPEIAEATKFWRLAIEKMDVERLYEPRYAKAPVIGVRRNENGPDPPDRDAGGHLQGEDLVLAKELLSTFDEAFAAARSARDAGGVANFEAPVDGSGVAASSNVNLLLLLAMTLCLKVETQLTAGDLDGAVDDLSTLTAVSDAFRFEPYVWHQRNRHQILEWAIDLVERMLATERLNDDQLRLLAQAFVDRDESRSLRLSIVGWRVQFVEMIEQADERFTQSLGIEHSSWARGADLAEGLDLLAQMDDASEQGLIAANERWQSVESELTALGAQPSARTRAPATLMHVPQIGQQLESHTKAEASVTLARTAIACERYRLANGKLPANLEDLSPEFLAEPPTDPCDGKPLRYVNDGSRTQLYSVGSDGVDDGGGAAGSSGAAMFTPADVVFRLKKTKTKASEAP